MIKTEVHTLIEPLIKELGYELWGVEYLSQGKHSLLRIYIDHEKGIGIQDCEHVSRQVNAVLDVEDPIKGAYQLEISSPGIPRPLFYIEHYQKFIGEPIQAKLNQPIAGNRKITGVILSIKDNLITLKIGDEEYEMHFSQIVKANLIGE